MVLISNAYAWRGSVDTALDTTLTQNVFLVQIEGYTPPKNPSGSDHYRLKATYTVQIVPAVKK